MPDPTLTDCLDDLAQTLEADLIEGRLKVLGKLREGDVDSWPIGTDDVVWGEGIVRPVAESFALLRNLGPAFVESWRTLAAIAECHKACCCEKFAGGPNRVCAICAAANAIHAALLAAREEPR